MTDINKLMFELNHAHLILIYLFGFLLVVLRLHRPAEHLQAFLLAELGTSGSVDSNNQLIIKGRFQQKQIESVLRRYISKFLL